MPAAFGALFDASKQKLNAIDRWIVKRQRELFACLLSAAVLLRILLVARSPTPFGYIWDFYFKGVEVIQHQHRLPLAADCWQCYHPPLFYVVAWPFYALGAAFGSESLALRMTAAVSLVSAAVTTYYGYALLRLYRCRGTALLVGFALLVIFPCLFISADGPEADILLTAIASAFIYYVCAYAMRPDRASTVAAARLGVLSGLALATKYSGFTTLVTAAIVLGGLAGGASGGGGALVISP